jgi:hypothetical protein
MNNFKKLPKIVLLGTHEYRWVNNILKLAKRERSFKYDLIRGEMGRYSHLLIKQCSEIEKDGHSGYSMSWSLALAGKILRVKSKIRQHESGHKCFE